MLGLFFVQLLTHIESRHGAEVVDLVLDDTLSTGGAYTAWGTYPSQEASLIVSRLDRLIQEDERTTWKRFGGTFFRVLARRYPRYLRSQETPFTLFRDLELRMFARIREVFPDAGFPALECSAPYAPGDFQLFIRLDEPMPGFAEGFVEACLHYFRLPIYTIWQDLGEQPGQVLRLTASLVPPEATSPNTELN